MNHYQVSSSTNATNYDNQKWSVGERLADKIAILGGSWKFLIAFAIFLMIWVLANSLIYLWQPADPLPLYFFEFDLILSFSNPGTRHYDEPKPQGRERSLSAQQDYLVNLKAELEIRNLHEKIDNLLVHQMEKMTKINQMQLELLEQLGVSTIR